MYNPQLKIGAISTYLDHLNKLSDGEGRLLYFRGHSKSSFKLEPSIYRNPGWIANEASMLKDLILRCPNDFSGGLSTFQCLVKMQHYGLPTRLLDVTSNPLVALHFACETHEKDDEDGEVIIFNYDVNKVKYFDSDTVSVLANLSRRPSKFTTPADISIEEFNKCEEIEPLLDDIRQDKPHFQPRIIPAHLGHVICVKPMLDNPRIIRQEGAFLLFGCNRQKQEPAELEEGSIAGRLIINRDKKKELSDQLGTLGVSKATMFPEIEQVAMHLRNSYYTPTVRMANLREEQKHIIAVLRDRGKSSNNDVAQTISMSATSVRHQIAKLAEMGIVESVGSGREKGYRIRESARLIEDENELEAD